MAAASLLLGSASALVGAAPAGTPFDPQAAQASLERGDISQSERIALLRGLTDAALRRKDYANTVAWSQKYVAAGGAETDVRPQLIQAYYAKEDWANAARELQWAVQAPIRAGKAPSQELILMLKNCYTSMNDANAIVWSLEQLVTWYPKTEYWGELLDRLQNRSDFGLPLALDVNRLRLLTGTLGNAAAYLALAAETQKAGFPAEALHVLDLGLSAGKLGTGPDAARHLELRRQMAEQTSQQARLIASADSERAASAATDGDDLVRLGFAWVTQGNPQRGIPLMEAGERRRVYLQQAARLHLGIAYLKASRPDKAIEVFAQVGGRHGAVDLARLWTIYTRNTTAQR
jgi:hypothetical protein